MQSKRKRASEAATSKGSRSDIKSLGFDYYITILMTATTIIAGWHIHDIWSGVVALLCGIISISFSIYMMGGVRDDS